MRITKPDHTAILIPQNVTVFMPLRSFPQLVQIISPQPFIPPSRCDGLAVVLVGISQSARWLLRAWLARLECGNVISVIPFRTLCCAWDHACCLLGKSHLHCCRREIILSVRPRSQPPPTYPGFHFPSVRVEIYMRCFTEGRFNNTTTKMQ